MTEIRIQAEAVSQGWQRAQAEGHLQASLDAGWSLFAVSAFPSSDEARRTEGASDVLVFTLVKE